MPKVFIANPEQVQCTKCFAVIVSRLKPIFQKLLLLLGVN